MQIASRISKPRVGKTFVIALSLLGVIALLQLGAIGWVFTTRYLKSEYAREAAARQSYEQNAQPQVAIVQAAPTPAPAVGAIPNPTPIPETRVAASSAPAVKSRVSELNKLAQTLRSNGDTATAVTRLREALAISPDNPQAMTELAMTYERMALTAKASEYWRKIYDIGPSAGIYYYLASAKLITPVQQNQTQLLQNPTQIAAASEDVQPGSSMGLMTPQMIEDQGSLSAKKFSLKIPVKARASANINAGQVAVAVLFYEQLDGKQIVTTSAKVDYHWITAPPNWAVNPIQVLEADYNLPKPDPKNAAPKEHRAYYGYIIRLYYNGELQDMRAEPTSLLKQFPPPIHLQNDAAPQ